MSKIRLVLCALFALLIPSVAYAAEAGAGADTADALRLTGVIAQVVAIAGLVARFAKVTTPLHAMLPQRWRWLPEAVVATSGTLTMLLPAASDWPTFGEVCLGAVVEFVGFAVAGYHAPDEIAPKAETTTTKAGTTLLVLLLAGLFGSGCAWLQENRGAIEDASGKVKTLTDADWLVCSQVPAKDRDFCLAMATALRAGNAAVNAALAEALEGQACPVPSAVGSAQAAEP